MESKQSNGTANSKNLQNNSNSSKEDDPTQLVQSIPLDETPFIAQKIQGQWFLTMGQYKISPNYPTLEEAKEDAYNNYEWPRILQVIQILIEANNHKQPANQTKLDLN